MFQTCDNKNMHEKKIAITIFYDYVVYGVMFDLDFSYFVSSTYFFATFCRFYIFIKKKNFYYTFLFAIIKIPYNLTQLFIHFLKLECSESNFF